MDSIPPELLSQLFSYLEGKEQSQLGRTSKRAQAEYLKSAIGCPKKTESGKLCPWMDRNDCREYCLKGAPAVATKKGVNVPQWLYDLVDFHKNYPNVVLDALKRSLNESEQRELNPHRRLSGVRLSLVDNKTLTRMAIFKTDQDRFVLSLFDDKPHKEQFLQRLKMLDLVSPTNRPGWWNILSHESLDLICLLWLDQSPDHFILFEHHSGDRLPLVSRSFKIRPFENQINIRGLGTLWQSDKFVDRTIRFLGSEL